MASSNQSIEAKRQESVEALVMTGVAFIIIVMATMYYYHHVWYYISYYLFKVISYIPGVILDWVFFWKDNPSGLIPAFVEDLAFRAEDYKSYYIDSESGNDKKKFMDRYGMTMMAPYFLLPIIYMIFKEFRRVTSPIKRPGVRGGESALYMYARSQADIWPYIKPVVNIMADIVKNPSLDSEWYAMSEIPILWLKNKGAIKELRKKPTRKLLTVRERSELNLDREASYRALKDNLGGIWKGLDALDENHQWVLAVIVPHIYGQVAVSRRLNRKISTYHESNKGKEASAYAPKLKADIDAEVKRIVEQYRDKFEIPYFVEDEFEDPYDPIISSFEELDNEVDMLKKGDALIKDTLLTHFYVKTVFFGLLKRSWTYGVLASAELLWIKKVDRDLWYVISQQGRTSAFIEVCGAWAHYLSEEAYGFRTLMPQLIEGFNAFDFELWSTHSNYVTPHNEWNDTAKWDKLVPDGVGKTGNFAKPPSSTDPTKAI
jgi:hypothetical protein